MTKRVLITGSNRGLGLEFTRKYLENGWHVYATCRHPLEALELQRLYKIYSELTIYRLDVTVSEDIANLCENLHNIPIDLLINTAEVSLQSGGGILKSLVYDEWMRTIEVNTIGTARLTRSLLNNMALSDGDKVIVVVSSQSTPANNIDAENNYSGNSYYLSSKAALNTFMRELATELIPLDIGVLLVDPGNLISRTGSGSGISPGESASKIIDIINNFSKDQSGKLFGYNGEELAY